MTPFDAARVLGLRPGVDDPDVIKRAYRRAAMLVHPDRPGGSRQRFEAVAYAYELLLDEATRPAPRPIEVTSGSLETSWRWPVLAWVSAVALFAVTLLAGVRSRSVVPGAVYALAWVGLAVWHAYGRPEPPWR